MFWILSFANVALSGTGIYVLSKNWYDPALCRRFRRISRMGLVMALGCTCGGVANFIHTPRWWALTIFDGICAAILLVIAFLAWRKSTVTVDELVEEIHRMRRHHYQ